MNPRRSFCLTDLGSDVPPTVAAALQGMAQSIEQLVTTINALTFATSLSMIRDGQRAGNFDAVFVTGRVVTGGVGLRLFHKLGRVPVGCLEVLTVPNVDQPGGAATNIAAPLAVVSMDASSIVINCSLSFKVFTLLVF